MADRSMKIALILAATDKASAVLDKAFSRAQKHAEQLEKASKVFNDLGDKSLIAGGAITAVFAKNVQDARESAIAQAKLIQGFKTMGGTAKQAQDAMDFAGKMQFEWGVEDEQIMDVSGKLSTFSRIITDQAAKNDVFNRSVQAAFDLQAKGFGDANSNIMQLGKALQNPALGAQALAKAGAINKEDLPVIKMLQATKGLGEAQVYVLKAVEKQVKGTAAAAADPMKKMQIGYSEVSESIGGALLPELNKLADKIGLYAPKIIAFVNAHKPLIIAIAKGASGLLVFGGAMKVVGFVMSSVSTAFKVWGGILKTTNFLVSNGGQIAAAAVKGYDAIKVAALAMKSSMITSVIPALRAAGTAIMEFGATLLASPITWYVAAAIALGAAVYFIIKNWDKISAFFARLWQNVKAVFLRFWDWAKSLFLNYTPEGLVIKNWSKIGRLFSGIWDNVKKVFSSAWEWVMNLGTRFFDAGKNIVSSIWNGMKGMVSKPVQLIADMAKKIRAYLPFSPAKTGALRDIHKIKLVETIAQSITAKPLLDRMDGVTGSLYNRLQRPIPVTAGSSSSGSMQITFSPTINLSGTATEADGKLIADTLQAQFEKMMKKYQQGRDRIGFN